MSLEFKPSLSETVNIPPCALPIFQQGQQSWPQLQWPTKQHEHWQYTSLRALQSPETWQPPAAHESVEVLSRVRQKLAMSSTLESYKLVLVNGLYVAALSDQNALPHGIKLVHFASASGEDITLIKQYLGRSVPSGEHFFSAVNGQLLQDGLGIFVADHVQLDKPIEIISMDTVSSGGRHIAHRVLVVLAPHARADILEQFVSLDNSSSTIMVTHAVTELYLENSARCDYYRVHDQNDTQFHLGNFYCDLAQHAILNSMQWLLGGALCRNQSVIKHLGNASESNLKGVYLPVGQQQADVYTQVEHIAEHTQSEQVFRGIVSDNAKAVFNGKIHIHPNAQKTASYLQNKNLLNGLKAEVNTKPELEIYANDVKCAHGATVAQMDEMALHYCRTRGINEQQAKQMLSLGFINEVMQGLKWTALADDIQPRISERLAMNNAHDVKNTYETV